MKLKKLELTAVEFFERVINGEKLYATANPKHAYYCVDTRGCIGNTIDPLVRINPSEKLNKPRTVWIGQQWYEDIPEQGVLCWWASGCKRICRIVEHIPFGVRHSSSSEFRSDNNSTFEAPIPLTNDEIKAFLPAEPVTKYDKSNWAENPSVEFPIECYVSDSDPQCEMDSDHSTVIIVDYARDHPIPFIDNYGVSWKYAIPVDE